VTGRDWLLYWEGEQRSIGRVVALSRPAYASTQGASVHPAPRVTIARYAARAAAVLSRRLRGGSGLVIGGRVLLAGGPQAATALSKDRRITLVSGTNGKTTTTALTAAALDDGRAVGTNRDGANTSAGLAGTLATTDEQRLVLEVDEGWLPWAVSVTSPASVVLTNLSRDQLSRHHEVGALAATWRGCLAGVPLVVANVDDPQVVWPALTARAQVWVSVGERWTADSLVCPACGGHCRRADRRRGRHWGCDSCGLHRPQPDWWLDGATLCGPGVRLPIELDLPGRFNLGNAALALVTAHVADGVPLEDAARRVTGVQSVAGRFELLQRDPHQLRVMLAKNPAGWLELLDLLAPDRHPLVLLFNADGVDGRDPSWLYDVSFAGLAGREVVVQGHRAADLLVRLELDGVPARRVAGPVSAALAGLPPGRVDVVGNYTAFRRALGELHHG
jgi:lipid II isoglutaminyl synthase (glutamine-hydrolysing)